MFTFPTPKDPNERLDYQCSFADRLEVGETLLTSEWLVEQGSVTLEDFTPPHSGGITTTWVVGGTHGEICVLTNRVTTSAGRTYDKSGRLRVRNRI